MRMNIREEIDGVNFHAEVEGVGEARTFLCFLDTLRPVVRSQINDYAAREPVSNTSVYNPMVDNTSVSDNLARFETQTAPTTLAGGAAQVATPKWTRENLQPIVVNLAKQRDKFVALLQEFGVARFRDLPDDKLNDFGIACEGVAA